MKLALFKVYCLLAVATTLSRLAMVAIFGPYQIPGMPWGSALQGELVVWFAMFVTVAGLATIAAAVRYTIIQSRRLVAYPGLVTGMIAVLFYTDVFGPNLIQAVLS